MYSICKVHTVTTLPERQNNEKETIFTVGEKPSRGASLTAGVEGPFQVHEVINGNAKYPIALLADL